MLKKILRFVFKYRILLILLVIFLLSSFINKEFLKIVNLKNILLQISSDGLIAIGMTFLIITACIDLSVGSQIALTSVIVIGLQSTLGTSFGIIIAIAAGILIGLVNGLLVVKVKVSPFISTLGMLTIVKGITLWLSDSRAISGTDPNFAKLAGSPILGIPLAFFLFIILVFISDYFLKNTNIGRAYYAIGANPEASKSIGIKVDRYLIVTYIFSSFTTVLGGIVVTSRINTGSPVLGNNTPLYVIAAVLIGGTSMMGGEGRTIGTMLGVLILGMLRNSLNLLGVGGYGQTITLGVIMIFVMLMDSYSRKSIIAL
jgi:ribose/xylose/arabinose/galactoside ABC-type transport system permease subunit